MESPSGKGKLDTCTQYIKRMRWSLFFGFIAVGRAAAAPRTIVVVDVNDRFDGTPSTSGASQPGEPLTLFRAKTLDSLEPFGQSNCGAREELLAVEMELLKKGGLELDTLLTENYLKLSHEARDYTLTDESKTLNVGGMATAQDLTQLQQRITDLREALDPEDKHGCRDYYFPQDFTTDAFLNYLTPLPEEVGNYDL